MKVKMLRLTAAGRLADPQRTELAHSLELLRLSLISAILALAAGVCVINRK